MSLRIVELARCKLFISLCCDIPVGTLVGAVVGDCLGGYWEMKSWKGTHNIVEVCGSWLKHYI